MMLHTKYQGSRPYGLRQEDFSMYSLYNDANVKYVTPEQGHIWPQGHNLSKFGRGPQGDSTYQISRL